MTELVHCSALFSMRIARERYWFEHVYIYILYKLHMYIYTRIYAWQGYIIFDGHVVVMLQCKLSFGPRKAARQCHVTRVHPSVAVNTEILPKKRYNIIAVKTSG